MFSYDFSYDSADKKSPSFASQEKVFFIFLLVYLGVYFSLALHTLKSCGFSSPTLDL